MNSTVSIKGAREGLTVAVGSGELASLIEAIGQRVAGPAARLEETTRAMEVPVL